MAATATGARFPAPCSVQEGIGHLAQVGRAHLRDRADLDLTHALETDAELGCNLCERVLRLAADSEPQADHVALAVRELPERLFEPRFEGDVLERRAVRTIVVAQGQDVAQARRVFGIPDR